MNLEKNEALFKKGRRVSYGKTPEGFEKGGDNVRGRNETVGAIAIAIWNSKQKILTRLKAR